MDTKKRTVDVLHTSKYFKPDEFLRCDPSCSIEDINVLSLVRLNALREKVGQPLVLSCAYRTSEHDKALGRSGNSAHTRGKAFDIICRDSRLRAKIVAAALDVNFHRIGIAATFVHVDDDTSLPGPCIWTY